MQFGAKPLFENVSVKFGNGNRYGLIGANGSGKSTLMKILGGDLEPSSGNVSKDPDERIGKLRQDQFAYEKYSVVDTVIMGNEELWKIKEERDGIYAKAEMSEEDGIRAGELEAEFAELDGYTALYEHAKDKSRYRNDEWIVAGKQRHSYSSETEASSKALTKAV